MGYKLIYLDNNATTPIDEDVKKVISDAFEIFGNPSSSHIYGIEARKLIEKARADVANLIGAEPSEVYFTSGGTESNNLAIIGTAYKYKRGHIITSVIEHPSVFNVVKWLESNGFEVDYLPVDSYGIVDPDDIKRAIRKDTILVTIMHSNNETGVLQPIKEIGKILKELNIPFHTDAAQSVGKIDVNVSELMVDMLTIVSHKFYGPKGVGAIYIKKGLNIMPIMFGAGHEKGIRPGTENVISISGFGKACELAYINMQERFKNSILLRERLYELLKSNLDLRLNGHYSLRLPNTLNISIKNIIGEDIVFTLKDRVAFSSGSACHAGVYKPSTVLKAMGLSDDEAISAIRLSVGKDNSIEEIEEASEIIISSIKNQAK